ANARKRLSIAPQPDESFARRSASVKRAGSARTGRASCAETRLTASAISSEGSRRIRRRIEVLLSHGLALGAVRSAAIIAAGTEYCIRCGSGGECETLATETKVR